MALGEYSAPPSDLSRLNPIQRYMQKGSLDKQDYVYLLIFVLAYFALRPYLKKGAAWFFAPEGLQAGQDAQKEYAQNRARAAVGANEIRGGRDGAPEELISENDTDVAATGIEATGTGQATNRRTKNQAPSKTEADKLLNWDDEPARTRQEGDQGDVAAWLDRWDK